MDELTDIQRRVFDFVRDKLVAGRPAPTAREVAAQFGWNSKRAAECHIEAIIRKGWLASEPGKARSLRLEDVAQAVRRVLQPKGTRFSRFGSQPPLANDGLEVTFRRAFAAPAKLGGHFPRRGRRATCDQFIANEIEHAALNAGQFIHI